ncbi:MAG: hypothetical protein H6824_14090 [Planctomycetaceae bacterium]|nr:hypothetical protein [Planctomycetaceae bacterium]
MLATGGDFSHWPKEDRERHIRSTDAALVSAMQYVLGQRAVYADAALAARAAYNRAASRAASRAALAASDAAYVAAEANSRADSRANSRAARAAHAAHAAHALNVYGEFVKATQSDYLLLVKARDNDRAVIQVLETPLFVHPPFQWGEWRSKLQGALLGFGLDSIWHRFEAVNGGRLMDAMNWEEDLARWQALMEEYQHKEKSSSPLESMPPETAPMEAVDDSPLDAVDEPPPRGFSHLHGTPVSLSDEVAESDLLGRTPLINALTRMFMAPQQGTPFTIALLANWGTGKSSVLNLVKKKIQVRARQRVPDSPGYREFDFAMFNAWEYEKTDSIAAGLAQEVVKGMIEGAGSKWERTKLIFWFCLREYQAKLVAWLMGINVFLILLFVTIASPGFRDVLFSLFSPKEAGGLSAVAVWGLLLAALYQGCRRLVLWWDDAIVQQVDTYLKLPNYDKQLGLIPLLRRQLNSLCAIRLGFPRWSFYRESMRGARLFVRLRRWLRKWYASFVSRGPRRLIVFVDDLDRCDTECIVSTFDAVRLVMDRKDVIVVIAIDPRIALKAIAEHYEKLADDPKSGKGRTKEEIARDYLGKIIQLPVQLSPPHPVNLEEFIQQRLFPDVKMSETAETSGGDTSESDSTGERKAAVSGTYTPNQENPGDDPPLPVAVAAGEELPPVVERYPQKEDPRPIPTAEEDAHILQETPDEVRLFTRLADGLDIHNPRRLTRLRNSYRLLKFIVAEKPSLYDGTPVEDSDEMARCTFLLNALFWFEFIGQCSQEDRDLCKQYFEKGNTNLPKVMYQTWKDQEVADIRTARSSPLFRQIQSLVLPHDIAGHNGYADGEAE